MPRSSVRFSSESRKSTVFGQNANLLGNDASESDHTIKRGRILSFATRIVLMLIALAAVI
jgi:hypothetical protein